MKIGYFLIILIILVKNSVHSMVFSDGLEHLDKLLQKSLRYKHHQLTLFRMGFFWAAHRWEGEQKGPQSLKSVTHTLQ